MVSDSSVWNFFAFQKRKIFPVFFLMTGTYTAYIKNKLINPRINSEFSYGVHEEAL
jgi:hypothetical protein